MLIFCNISEIGCVAVGFATNHYITGVGETEMGSLEPVLTAITRMRLQVVGSVRHVFCSVVELWVCIQEDAKAYTLAPILLDHGHVVQVT